MLLECNKEETDGYKLAFVGLGKDTIGTWAGSDFFSATEKY